MCGVDPIFEDDGKWYFWDETWTSYLGPFPDESHARHGLEEYGNYLSTGEHTGFLTGTKWFNGYTRKEENGNE